MAPTPIRSCLCSPNAVSHFPRKLRISSKMSPFWLPFSITLGTFSSLLLQSGPRGPGPRPKALKVHQNGAQGYPKGAPGCPKWSPRVPKWSPRVPKCPPEVTKSTKKTPKCTQGWQTGGPRYHNGAPRSPKVLQRRHKPFKVPLQNPNVHQGAKKQASTHRHKQPTNQISKEGQK